MPDPSHFYAHGPLSEVVLGLLHAPSPVSAQMAGIFWSQRKDAYPECGTAERIELEAESFELLPPGLRLQLGPPAIRTLLQGADQLVQIQDNAFLLNWRNLNGNPSSYPRFGTLKQQFMQEWQTYSSLHRAYCPNSDIAPYHAEITYVNSFGKDVFLAIAKALDDDTEEMMLVEKSPLKHQGKTIGRFILELGPSVHWTSPQSHEIRYVMKLTARAWLQNLSPEEFFDLGHAKIISVFESTFPQSLKDSWR